jgi:hypothetical protein
VYKIFNCNPGVKYRTVYVLLVFIIHLPPHYLSGPNML